MDDFYEDNEQEEFEGNNSRLGDYADYFENYNDDLDPDQQDPDFWNQF